VTARAIREEVIVADHPVLQQRVAYLLPVIPEHAPYRIREGIARRRVSALTGACPCGAAFDLGDVRAGAVEHVGIQHEDGCPAVTETLIKAIRRWVR